MGQIATIFRVFSLFFFFFFGGVEVIIPIPDKNYSHSAERNPFSCAHNLISGEAVINTESDNLFVGQPFAYAHFNTSRCLPPAAAKQTPPAHRHQFSLAHFNTSRCPPAAASKQTSPSH